jgi:hypothetical protein
MFHAEKIQYPCASRQQAVCKQFSNWCAMSGPAVSRSERAIKIVLYSIYMILLGWWSEPVVQWCGHRYLRRQCLKYCSFLFDEYGGKFVPNRLKDTWGKIVTIEARNLLLIFTHDRGEFEISIAPAHCQAKPTFITTALGAIERDADRRGRLEWRNMEELGALLRSKIAILQDAYSETIYPATKQLIGSLSQAAPDGTTSRGFPKVGQR